MKRAVAFVGWWLLTGCGASGGQIASLEAELRRVRTVQEQQATQIEQLQHRVILTEDAARDARRAVEHSGRLATVRLGSDPPAVEPIRVDASARPEPAEAAEPESSPRPVLRATRSDRMPPPGGFAVREGDRLPVARRQLDNGEYQHRDQDQRRDGDQKPSEHVIQHVLGAFGQRSGQGRSKGRGKLPPPSGWAILPILRFRSAYFTRNQSWAFHSSVSPCMRALVRSWVRLGPPSTR